MKKNKKIIDLLNTEILPFSVEYYFYAMMVFMGAFYAFLYLLAIM
jgi:hypothetical protein